MTASFTGLPVCLERRTGPINVDKATDTASLLTNFPASNLTTFANDA